MFCEVRLTRYAARPFIKLPTATPNRILYHLRLNHQRCPAMSSPESLSFETVHTLLSDTNLSASSFVQSVLTTVFQSSLETESESDSSQAILDQLFSPNCEVRRDHLPQSLAELKDDFVARRAGCRTASVKFEQIISTNDDKPEQVSLARFLGSPVSLIYLYVLLAAIVTN